MTNRVKEKDNRAQDLSPFPNEDVSSVQYDPSPNDPHHPENNNVRYRVTMARRDAAKRNERGALVDGGVNGGICGDDAKPMHECKRMVDVTGMNQHKLSGLNLCDCAARTQSSRGPIIGTFHNYAYFGKHRSIHSSGQI